MHSRSKSVVDLPLVKLVSSGFVFMLRFRGRGKSSPRRLSTRLLPSVCAGGLFPLLLLLSSCSSSKPDAAGKTMEEYERSFDPGKYAAKRQRRIQPKPEFRDSAEQESNAGAPIFFDRMEKSMGYRLQVYSTTSVDDASNRREYLRTILDSTAIDLVFDAPYYKLRLGSFLDRKEAEAYRSELQSKGINDAWIVRDRVYTLHKEQAK
jgi:hypothetical protein